MAATLLAVRSGRIQEARQHFDRTLELVAEDFNPHRPYMTLTGIELMIAEGRAEEAVTWARPRLSVPDYPEPDDDAALTAFVRAAAVAARDGDRQALTAMVESVLAKWPTEPFEAALAGVDVQAMDRALLAAELARCRDTPDQPELWGRVVEAAGTAGNRWHEAMARWRCADAGLSSGWVPSKAGELLREAHRSAVELGAVPLRVEVEALARRAKVDLRAPVPVEVDGDDPRLAGLTEREREVLAFLVAGRSNGEIAKELFISDKTVSVHVSHILRKTGTATRVTAAAWAERRLPGH